MIHRKRDEVNILFRTTEWYLDNVKTANVNYPSPLHGSGTDVSAINKTFQYASERKKKAAIYERGTEWFDEQSSKKMP